jgi:hypothetical protein
MSKAMFAAMLASAALAGLLAAGCGGASGASGGGDTVVAKVGSTPITESTLNHWVATFVRGDFYEAVGQKAPAGLGTDPPNYPSCVQAAKAIAPSRSSGKRILSKAQLEHRCRVLYRDVAAEALTYLISALWTTGQGAELGKHVTDQEVQRYLSKLVRERYKTTQAFAEYLASKGLSVADMQYLLKRNLLAEQVGREVRAKAQKLGGQQALIKSIAELNARWTEKTHCRAGHLVAQCHEYTAGSNSTESSPAIIFEEMRGSRFVQALKR